MLTAKSILSSYNLLEQKEESKKKAKNEFQAYAYRLAHDLNDLVNLKIYMKLAKNVERSLMERAYSFVSDSRSNDKGRLFLWKLKNLRKELEKKLNAQNYTYPYVIKCMKEFRNKLSRIIIDKSDLEFTKEVESFITKFVESQYSQKKKKLNILLIGNSSKKLAELLISFKANVYAYDLSTNINKSIRNSLKGSKSSKNIKMFTKDFMLNKHKDNLFDFAIISNFWHIIPSSAELEIIKIISRITKPESSILLNSKHVSKNIEEWKDFEFQKETLSFFTKSKTKDSIEKDFAMLGYSTDQNKSIDGCEYYIFSKI